MRTKQPMIPSLGRILERCNGKSDDRVDTRTSFLGETEHVPDPPQKTDRGRDSLLSTQELRQDLYKEIGYRFNPGRISGNPTHPKKNTKKKTEKRKRRVKT